MTHPQIQAHMTVATLLEAILDGALGPNPANLMVTGASQIYQTTKFSGSAARYHNYYMLLRVEDAFGACSYTKDQLGSQAAAELSGGSLAEALRDERMPVRIAAMDAYLGTVYPHRQFSSGPLTIPPGTPIEKANRRDSAIAELAAIAPGQQVALIGVVNPLVEAIQARDAVCLPCDLQLEMTNNGQPVEKDMEVVVERADSIICTGMTLSNGSFDRIVTRARERAIPLTVYAQTGSAIAARFVGAGVTALLAEPFPFTQFSSETSQLYTYQMQGGDRP